ncbi:3-keto-5-aminohexanoate cleavage protein [Pseudorhodoplanes sp.]|uniref:3-keto-5-aminohexanoate cleavage protein n=1 Tax=Pseudorhodoplanes sp. TaxID=1934341 RepID=UPI003D0A4246
MRQPREKIFITCAVTGNLTKPEQTPYLPITPQQIADASLEAADAGAAIVHIHVRDPHTGNPSMELDYYRDAVEQIRGKNRDLILNLTTGPGGRFVPSHDNPRIAGPGTTLIAPERRVEHIAALKPDICTLDLNTMNSGGEVVINTPQNIRRMAKIIRESGVKPEIELFDSGDIALMHALLDDGTLQGPVLCSLVTGVRYGFQPSPETVIYARNLLPPNTEFTAIGVGRASFTMVAHSYLAGGHVRVGLEDAVYLSRGQLAKSNAAMVEKAKRIVEDLGGQIATPLETRDIIGLPQPAR